MDHPLYAQFRVAVAGRLRPISAHMTDEAFDAMVSTICITKVRWCVAGIYDT